MPTFTTQPLVAQADRKDETRRGSDRRLLMGYLHKTSNTLCGIKGYASLIADMDLSGPKAEQWARKIILEVERMEEIFRSVGDLTRGRQNPDPGIDLAGFVTATAMKCADNLETLNLEMAFLPDGQLKLPAADLGLILNEVLKNSAESPGPDSSTVKVDLAGENLSDGNIYLTIQDNGCGMDPELLAQATDPFITTKDHHHGVGLTRVATLMDMYGLDWNLASEEGRGTRVILEVGETL